MSVSSRVRLPDGRAVTEICTTMSKFYDGFNATGSTDFDSTKWQTIRKTGGITLAGTTAGLVVSVPVTAGAELLVIGRQKSTIPSNLSAIVAASARIANTAVRIGYLAVDPATGLPIDHASISGDFAHSVRFAFTGTVATTASLETTSGSSAVKSGAFTSTTSASPVEALLEVRPEDASATTLAADNGSTRGAGSKINSVMPDPNLVYVPFIWIRNSAASTAATWTFYRLLSADIQELQAEVGGGRGNSFGSQSIPVNVQGTVAMGNASVTSSSNNVTGSHNLIAAATTNSTLVKSSAGKLISGRVYNASAAVKFLKVYNKATAPTVGTDTPVLTLPIPAGAALDLWNVFGTYGLYFATGIGYGITGLAANADTTAVAAGDVIVSILYA